MIRRFFSRVILGVLWLNFRMSLYVVLGYKSLAQALKALTDLGIEDTEDLASVNCTDDNLGKYITYSTLKKFIHTGTQIIFLRIAIEKESWNECKIS